MPSTFAETHDERKSTDEFCVGARSLEATPTKRKEQETMNVSQVGRVIITVSDTDKALDFYTGKLGFEKGVDVDPEVSRMGGPVPPMFWFRDQDKNTLLVVEPTR